MDEKLRELGGECEGTSGPKMEGRHEAFSIDGGGLRMDVEDAKG